MEKIDCKAMADAILEKVAAIPNKTKALLILSTGDDPASAAYMRGKVKDCERCGIPVLEWHAETQGELLNMIANGNAMPSVGGIIVQLPLPKGWDEEAAVNAVRIDKDVDGFRAGSRFKPCTPEAIIHILKHELGDNLAGTEMLLIGKGKLVGKPLIPLLLEEGVTLMVAHSRTRYVKDIASSGWDAVITATGKSILQARRFWDEMLVIDAGIHRGDDGKLHGDVDWSEASDFGGSYTSVPGGVGLLTRAMLLKHMGEVQ